MGLNFVVGTAIVTICVFGWAVHSFNFRYSKKILKWTRFEAKREPWDIIHPVQSSNPYEKRYNSGFKTVTEYNWKYGMCKHQIIFEGTSTIRRFRFCGNLLAFAFLEGKVCLIRQSTGEVLDKFFEHKTEISALDFDGINLCSAGADGHVKVYNLTYNNPSTFGSVLHSFSLHKRSVSGMKIVLDDSDKKKEQRLLVTCSMDKTLACVDLVSGSVLYQIPLSSSPLCMSYADSYIAIGMIDGNVNFYKAKTGKKLLEFKAHSTKVRSVHLLSQTSLVTGSSDGIVRLWDLTGDDDDDVDKEEQEEKIAQEQLFKTNTPTRFIDYYFAEALSAGLEEQNEQKAPKAQKKRGPNGSHQDFIEKDHSVAVVSLQADEEKILAAYDDGIVRCWSIESGEPSFELQGRNNLISTVQFDSTRLIADGTYSVVVLHDFSEASEGKSTDEFLLSVAEDSNIEEVEEEEEEEEGDDYDEEDDGEEDADDEETEAEDGRPSATS